MTTQRTFCKCLCVLVCVYFPNAAVRPPFVYKSYIAGVGRNAVLLIATISYFHVTGAKKKRVIHTYNNLTGARATKAKQQQQQQLPMANVRALFVSVIRIEITRDEHNQKQDNNRNNNKKKLNEHFCCCCCLSDDDSRMAHTPDDDCGFLLFLSIHFMCHTMSFTKREQDALCLCVFCFCFFFHFVVVAVVDAFFSRFFHSS